ncbi:MAG TPA: hypothetical protein VN605_13800, partial [Thermoanaerobaculia bacterium]|nr:hypothetical protein [Thermoanaerobaculia bacterium]
AYTIEAKADGYTSVWRQVVVPPGTGVVPIDIRLTLRGAAQTAGTTALTLEQGGDTTVTKKATLAIPAASLAAGRKVRLTAIGAQSLAGLLPLGWSPAAAAEIALDDSPLPQPLAGSRLTFDLTADASAIATSGQTLSLVAYDRERDEWRVVQPVVTLTNGNAVVDITTSGNFALVYPDKAAQLAKPPAAHAGAALAGVVTPCTAAPCELRKRAFDFVPRAIPPSGRAAGILVLEGASAFPSGTALQAVIDEQLNLADGTTLVDPPFATDLLVYRNYAGDAAVAAFHLAPTAKAKSVTLRDGVDRVRIVEYPGRVDRGALIGADGGRVAGDDSVTIDVPAGATTEALHASVVSIPADELARITVAGFRVTGGFTFTLTRATNAVQPDLDGDGQPDAQPAPVLQLPAKATFAVIGTAPQAIIAELLPSTPFGAMVRLAARAAVTTSPIDIPNAKLFATRTESLFPVDGIVRDGRYLILVPSQPIAFAYGQVVAGSSPLLNAAVTSGAGSPFTTTLGVADRTRRGG